MYAQQWGCVQCRKYSPFLVTIPSTNVGASSPWPFGKRLILARSCFGWMVDHLSHKSGEKKKKKNRVLNMEKISQ
jgi:hypothetical protein